MSLSDGMGERLLKYRWQEQEREKLRITLLFKDSGLKNEEKQRSRNEEGRGNKYADKQSGKPVQKNPPLGSRHGWQKCFVANG